MNQRMWICQSWAVLVLLLAISPLARAHDSWLVADRHTAGENEAINLRFTTGAVFPIGDADTQLDRVATFNVARQGRIVSLENVSMVDRSLGASYASTIQGLHVLGCALKSRLITLESGKFDSYLREEHADDAIRIRAEKPSPGDVVEMYTKFTKTIAAIGTVDPADRTHLMMLGHRLEIIPLSNPLSWKAGQGAVVCVLLDGHAWPGISVSAGHEKAGAHAYAFEGRTDANGEITVPLSASGLWFIKAHIIREAGPLDEHQWESFWASFTFPVAGNASALPQDPPEAIASRDITEDVRAIVAIHGELSPWAAMGFRMGRRAMADLKMSPGDERLLAIHRTPFEPPYTIVADGMQAATRASIGRLTLLIAKVDLADMRSEFMDRKSGEGVTLRISPALLAELGGLKSSDEADALAMRILILKDSELFTITESDSMAPPAEPTSLPTTRTADREKRIIPMNTLRRPSASTGEQNGASGTDLPTSQFKRIGLSESLVLACRLAGN